MGQGTRMRRGTRPTPTSLNSTTFRIAVKDAAATVREASPGAGVAGATGPASVSLTGRWPLLGANDGACNAPVAAPMHHRVFYKYTNLGFIRA